MTVEKVKRKLAAILSADMEGRAHRIFVFTNLSDRNQPVGQIGQEENGDETAATECHKPQPLTLFVSKRFHGMLCP